jgi:hypothetical protein
MVKPIAAAGSGRRGKLDRKIPALTACYPYPKVLDAGGAEDFSKR